MSLVRLNTMRTTIARGMISVSTVCVFVFFFFFSSRRRHTRLQGDWSSDVCSSDLGGSDLILTQGAYINDRGEILATGVLPNGDMRSVLLVPCGKGTEGCQDVVEGTAAIQKNRANSAITRTRRRLTPGQMLSAWRARLAQRYHIPGLGAPRN